jgi:hypothetical protein
MQRILAAVRFVGDLFKARSSAEFEAGKGPYSAIDADDGTAWNIYRRSGKKYDY